jgi:hypothetical protein
MPQVAVAVVAAIASSGAAAASAAGGFTIFGLSVATTASLVGGLVGAVVSFGLNYALRSITQKKSNNAAGSGASTQSAADSKVLIRAPVEARRVIYGRTRVSGAIVYAFSSGADQSALTLVIALATHRCEGIEAILFNDDVIPTSALTAGNVTSGKYAGLAFIDWRLGTQTEAHPFLVANSPDTWDGTHILSGITYLVVSLNYDRTVYQQGIPNISVIISGKDDIIDPRPGTTSPAYTENWALIIRDYLKAPFGLACGDDEIDEATFQAAANLSDELVPLNADGTETQLRYTLGGSFKLDEAPIDVVGSMLAAGGGALVYVAGKYRLYGGAYSSPTATLDASDFAGDVELVTRPARRDLFNTVRGTFINPASFWQPADFPAQVSTEGVTADGETIVREIDLPWTTDPTRAQRIARQLLRRARQWITLRAPMRYEHIQLTVWQMVAVTMPDFGWTAKPFRVVSWSYDPPTGAINVTLQEEQVNSYAWTFDAAELVPEVPDTTLVSPVDLPEPTSLSLTASTSLQGDGTVAPAIIATWLAAPHPFVTSHEVQWRAQPAGAWSALEVPSGTNRAVLTPVVVGQGYDVRVRAVGGLARSDWSATASIFGAPDTTAPGLPGFISATGVQRGYSLRWFNPSDSDLAAVEVWESATEAGTYSYVGESAGTGFLRSGASPNETRWFRLRSRDRSGNVGSFTGVAAATAPRAVTDDIGGGQVTTPIIASGGVSTFAYSRQLPAPQSLARPASGVATGEIGSAVVTFDGDARAIITARYPFATFVNGSVVESRSWQDMSP